MKYYGYNFTKRNSGGLGAIIHDVMNAAKYAQDNDLILGNVFDPVAANLSMLLWPL